MNVVRPHWQERYESRLLARRCIGCGGKLGPGQVPGQRCPKCRPKHNATARKYGRSAKGLARKRLYRQRPDVQRREARKKRKRDLEHKVAGTCKDCKEPCTEESVYCPRHLEVHRKASKDYSRRRREAMRTGRPMMLKPRGPRSGEAVASVTPINKGGAPRKKWSQTSTPIADYENGDLSLSEAAMRYVELCNGIEARDVGDAFAASDQERNGISTALRRGVRTGRLVVEGHGPERIFYPARRARRAA